MSKLVSKKKLISESRDKKKIPTLLIMGKGDEVIRSYNLPVGAHLMVNDNEKSKYR
jgi:DNA-directed RNA polymerase subunit beta'